MDGIGKKTEEVSSVESPADADVIEEEDAGDMEECERLKIEGNRLYKAGEHAIAIQRYSEAMECCPKNAKTGRSILFANRAACHSALGQVTSVISDCTVAIELDERYVKAYLRRSHAAEQDEKFQEALDDLTKVAELDPAQKSSLQPRMRSLEIKAKEKFEKDKEEVMGKLKDAGNWLLGKVGLSLDNFQVEEKEPGGGYNISFKQNDQGNTPP